VTKILREALDRVCEGGPLLGVDVFRFQGDPNFVTAVRFRFGQDEITFRAVADDDTVTAEYGPTAIEDDGTWVNVSAQPGWSDCVSGHSPWAWTMTNQQGYTDAVRIEFAKPPGRTSRVVEFVVVASAFRFFVAHEM
jgi:hypothetical protein